ncbi:MAG: ATP synthase F1 subunit delta [Clostridia bacterium]|nr:ATP synthase F1 subunit delta [Clostridia bacterium]
MKAIINEYAEALFSIAAESGELDAFSNELSEMKKLISKNEGYTEFLSCPSLPLSERLSAIDEAFLSFHHNIVSFLKLLTEKGRIKDLSSCIDEFNNMLLAFRNTETVKVYSRVPLTDEQKAKLIEKLSEKYKKNINAVYETDEALLGGIKIVAGDMLIDGSIKKGLKDLKEVIEK